MLPNFSSDSFMDYCLYLEYDDKYETSFVGMGLNDSLLY
jgi:hypothetical protein